MQIFSKLKKIRAFERQHMPLLETLEDFDIVREIGFHQERAMPLTLKLLLLADIASAATVNRRLQRLKALGLVQHRQSDADRRMIHLRLSPALQQAFGRYVRLLAA